MEFMLAIETGETGAATRFGIAVASARHWLVAGAFAAVFSVAAAAPVPIAAEPPSAVTPIEPVEATDATDATAPTEAPREGPAFELEIHAPSAIRELLDQHLELKRYRAVSDLDEVELTRLMVLAEADARKLLGTLGYFSPRISLSRKVSDGSAAPLQRPIIVLDVDPGEPVTIAQVEIDFSGDIAESTDDDVQAQRDEIRHGWLLPGGQRFTQNRWEAAKTQALRALVAHRYPAGRLADSEAEIDPVGRQAALSLRLDSGPPYRLGAMQVNGLKRYDPLLVSRLARLKPGAVYDQNRLLEAQQRLASSGFFDSVFIFIKPEGDPSAVPVEVQVREAALQKVVLGVGVSTDSGPHASIEHTHHRLPGIDWQATSKLQLERKAPYVQTDWVAPPDEDNARWGVLARAERLDDGALVTRSQRLRFGRSQAGDHIDRNIYLQYDRASVQTPAGATTLSSADSGDGSALSANYVWTGRYFDRLPFPGKGYGLGFELGGGFSLSEQRQPFVRATGRWLGVKSLRNGRLVFRLDGGAVLAADSARVPATQLFRTGGDSTVRGYPYRAIGVERADGVTGPGRYLANGSIEWQLPIRRNGLPSEWEHTLFIDVGSVAEQPKELQPVVGVGTGLRWRSPIGPLQIDLAYGLKVQRFRLHMSVGFIF